MKTYTVRVTQKDIDAGLREDCTRCCPVALAVHRATDDAAWRVSRDNIWKSAEQEYSLPREAVLFIQAFDTGRAVKPFTFSLSIP